MPEIITNVRGHSFFSPPLGPKSVVVDLGANRGDFSRLMKGQYGGTYYLVEANPRLADALRADGFPVVNCAVAATDGPTRLNVAQNDEGSSILPLPGESELQCTLSHVVEVPGKRLETILSEIGEPRIDLLKMDIEGAEVQVLDQLSGATLRNIGQLTVEFHSDPMFRFGLQSGAESTIARLRDLGFLCLDFSWQRRLDVLFVNRAFHGISRLRGFWWEYQNDPNHWVNRVRDYCPSRVRKVLRTLMEKGMGRVG
jgi:FkbM family methyltransferase